MSQLVECGRDNTTQCPVTDNRQCSSELCFPLQQTAVTQRQRLFSAQSWPIKALWGESGFKLWYIKAIHLFVLSAMFPMRLCNISLFFPLSQSVCHYSWCDNTQDKVNNESLLFLVLIMVNVPVITFSFQLILFLRASSQAKASLSEEKIS